MAGPPFEFFVFSVAQNRGGDNQKFGPPGRRALHQRRKRAQEPAGEPAAEPVPLAVLDGDLSAFGQRLLIIRLDCRYRRGAAHQGRAFKVEVQTAVVQVDAAGDGGGIVADEGLGVNKAGGVFVDLDAAFDQFPVVGAGQGEDGFLVRAAGRHQLHVHAALGGKDQRRDHLMVDDQIGRHNVDIFLGAVKDVQIDRLADIVPIERAVSVWNDPAGGVHRGRCRQIAGAVLHPTVLRVPHLQEHQREGADRLAGDTEGHVLPVAVGMGAVDIFVRQIDPAGEGAAAVHHQDFPVVAVVVVGGDQGAQRGVHAAADAKLFQLPGVLVGQLVEGAGAVVENADLYALLGLLLQDLEDAAPHVALVDDKVLHKDEAFGAFQLCQHGFESFFTDGVIVRAGVLPGGKVSRPLQVGGQTGQAGVCFLQAAVDFRLGGEETGGLPIDFLQAGPDQTVAQFFVYKEVKGNGKDRGQHNQEDPGDFGIGIPGAVDHDEGHDKAQQQGAAVDKIIPEPVEAKEKQAKLNDQKKDDHRSTAKDQAEESSFSFIQQQDGLFVQMIHFILNHRYSPVFPGKVPFYYSTGGGKLQRKDRRAPR